MPGPRRRRRNRMHRENSARVAGEDSRPFFTPPCWARLALRFCIVTELRGDQPAKNAVPFDAQKSKTVHTQEMFFCNKARWAACGRSPTDLCDAGRAVVPVIARSNATKQSSSHYFM